MENLLFLNGTTNEHRPIYRGNTTTRAFLKRYGQWCARCGWKNSTKSANLTYCVDEKFEDRVRNFAFPGDDCEVAVEWPQMKAFFIAEFSTNGRDAHELSRLERKLNTIESSRMRPNERVMDFKLRFNTLCQKVNAGRRRFSGSRPPAPATALQSIMRSLSSRGPLDFDSLDTPRKKNGEAPNDEDVQNFEAAKKDEGYLEYLRMQTALKSNDYKKAVEDYSTWEETARPELTREETMRLFMDRVNKRYYEKINVQFTPTSNTMEDVIEFMQRLEDVQTSKTGVSFDMAYPPRADDETPTTGASVHLKQLMASINELREDNITLRAEIKSRKPEMHPDRAALCSMSTPGIGRATSDGTCLLCNATDHSSIYLCPNLCANCGGNHNANKCTTHSGDLWCECCTRYGHVEKVCTKKKLGFPPNWIVKSRRPSTQRHGGRGGGRTQDRRRPRGRDDRDTACFRWAKQGSCSYGDRCRFEHSKRPRPSEAQPPVPLNQAATPLAPAPPTINSQGYQPHFQPMTPHGYYSQYGIPPAPTPPPKEPMAPPPYAQLQQITSQLADMSRRQNEMAKLLSPSKSTAEQTQDLIRHVEEKSAGND